MAARIAPAPAIPAAAAPRRPGAEVGRAVVGSASAWSRW